MTTRDYCEKLLEEVEAAGRDPNLAYLVRTRLRRALVALERGRVEDSGGLLNDAPEDVRALTKQLGSSIAWLCQPSEALDVRWGREWRSVLEDVDHLRQWVRALPSQ